MGKFEDICGQEHLKEYFKKSIESGNIAHAYILSGEIRSGKEFVATIFAQALQCEAESGKPCGKCVSCRQMEEVGHPDIRYVTHSKPNVIGIDDVREKIIDDVALMPAKGPYKIYIMNEAEKLTPQAQNALLKTIEEPPEYAIFLLLATSQDNLLQTICSRCVTLSMRPVADNILRQFLIDNYQVPDYKADITVAFARGNLGRAKMLVTSEDFDKIRAEAVTLLRNIDEMEMNDIAISVKNIFDYYKVGIDDYLDIMSIWYRDALLFKATNDVNGLIFKDEIQYIKRVAKKSSYEGIEIILDAIEKAKTRLNANVNGALTMELLLLTIKEN